MPVEPCSIDRLDDRLDGSPGPGSDAGDHPNAVRGENARAHAQRHDDEAVGDKGRPGEQGDCNDPGMGQGHESGRQGENRQQDENADWAILVGSEAIRHVLGAFSGEENDALPGIIDRCIEGIELWLRGDMQGALNRINTTNAKRNEGEEPKDA